MLMAIAHFILFYIFAKITKWRTFFEKREKNVFFRRFLHTRKQSKSKFKNVLDMRYSYSSKEYVVKIL